MKILVLLLASFFLSSIANAGIVKLFDSNISGYTITDESKPGDEWSDTYGGYHGSDFTGYYLGTILGNDNEMSLKTLISYYLATAYDIITLEKVDAPATSSGSFSVFYNDPATSGTWSTMGSNPALAVSFYTVKSSTEYSLYYVTPALQDGSWVTKHLLNNGGQIPAVSHISASLVNAPIPEPATMLLFGTGLMGLAGARLRMKKN